MASDDETVIDRSTRQWGDRRKLPSRRNSTTFSLCMDDQKIFLTVGTYSDGMVGEIFVNLDREGSTLATMCNSWCITFSYALQYGVPLDKLVNKFLWTRCEPCGGVSGHPDIIKAYSIQDLVVRVLAIEYLGRTELVNLRTSSNRVEMGLTGTSLDTIESEVIVNLQGVHKLNSKMSGYTGEFCRDCGSDKMKRTGTCATCETCGSTSGCS